MKIAVLDDWQSAARQCADWSALQKRAEVIFFETHLGGVDAIGAALAGFDIIMAMRERTAFPAALIAKLPKLRMIAATGSRAPSLDLDACTTRGILVCNTGGEKSGAATAELALGLLIAATRNIPAGDMSTRAGQFQSHVPVGEVLEGKTLGIIGLGRIGTRMVRYGQALGMSVLTWSQNLTAEKAQAAGATYVDKAEILAKSDALSLHLVLSDRTRGILGADDLAKMKPGAILINTSRGPLVDEAALVENLRAGHLRAGLDVFAQEPLPKDYALLGLPNVVLTPHLGYCTREVYGQFYGESIENVLAFLDEKPIRMLNPRVVE